MTIYGLLDLASNSSFKLRPKGLLSWLSRTVLPAHFALALQCVFPSCACYFSRFHWLGALAFSNGARLAIRSDWRDTEC